MEINLRDLSALDEISISTRQSYYRFQVIDPDGLRGLLKGGVLGDQEYQAIFCGTLISNVLLENPFKLKTGGHAVFYVARENGLKRLTTSAITAVAYNRRSESINEC